MRKVKKPSDLPKDVLLTCISNYQDEDLITRMESAARHIVAASDLFEEKVTSKTLHTFEPHEGVSGIVSTQEMKNVYNDKLAKKGQPGRDIYDRILNAPKLNKCPICGHRVVSTLDHHLPKAKFPALSVTPINLIPSCFDCNKTKTAARPLSAEEETLHPYFDDVEEDLWLKAKILEVKPIAFIFFVTQPENWDDLKYMRAKNHLKIFELGRLFSINAAEEYTMRELTLKRIYSKAGSEGLKIQLQDYAESAEAVHLNSWQSAMFRALEDSNWYLNNYFNTEVSRSNIK
ncbi:HNH endonuclease [Fictibacillus sp. KU28468]|uniref:HNH endonuclease n=1 Tax=Fictibacillus sp. KU28468 TaxID=2991053 RepID=UPI00223DCBFA|nr:HNH endonuclease [Fictibacillus sp. KU28468]UZJ79566.1 hypothetical protein OKX00_03520 [Fictibacillus sp. KU28468]